MFIRRIRKSKNDTTYDYWALMRTVRTERGPRQKIVGWIGKTFDLEKEERIGWENIGDVLNGGDDNIVCADLFKKQESEYKPDWTLVDIKGIKIERVRQFGNVYLGLWIWKRLRLDKIFNEIQSKGKEEINWSSIYCILSIARLCNPSSELHIAEHWYDKTALDDLIGVSEYKINEDRLYRALDHILKHKDAISRHLQNRYADLFGIGFEFLIYDITSIYFEGQCKKNPQAKRGYSRDKRPDCLQVCLGLVVSQEGLPLGYEIFDGNRRDVTTLDEIIELMEKKYGKAKRTWVFDRGIVSEENLETLREKGALYIVGTSKGFMKQFEKELSEEEWEEVEDGVEVKMIKTPDNKFEKFIICKSVGREEKEKAILELQKMRLKKRLENIRKLIQKGKLKDISLIERRIGKWMGRYTKAERLYTAEIIRNGKEITGLNIHERKENMEWANKSSGHYILRTNCTETDPKIIWKIYMQLNQAESSFRIGKSNLQVRPVYHQIKERVQAHIFVCFLALCLWRTLEQITQGKGIGNCVRKLLNEMSEIRSMDVILPVKDRSPLRLRLVAKPEDHLKELMYRLNLKLPNQPKILADMPPIIVNPMAA